MFEMSKVASKTAMLLLACAAAFAGHVMVDMDTRSDATETGFLSWQPLDGAAKMFGDVTVSFEMPNLPAYTEWTINWLNKNGLSNYELAMDGLYAEFDDDVDRRPSFNGGTIRLSLSGLTAGEHTFISYHNALWPVTNYNRTIADCKISVNGAELMTITPSQYATRNEDVKTTFFSFTADGVNPVVITFEPVGDPATQIFTAILNGFEIDNLAPVYSYATYPSPESGDMHVFANNDEPLAGSAGTGTVTLGWSASNMAAAQDVYLGTDEIDVSNADTNSPLYMGRLSATATQWQAGNLDSKNTYCWRVDTVLEDGSAVKGYVWKFKTRHLAYAAAEGYGRFANGGRFGRVVEVTTLEDYNPGSEAVIEGSLRKAIEADKGARTVVFKVGGTIVLKAKLIIPADSGGVYVAGQTAPGEGICVTRYPFGMLGAQDAIIRFVRTRVGDYAQISLDGMGMASSDNSIIDHCSISWSIDEGHSSRGAKNITFSYNIISEALNDSYQYADHAYAASISGSVGSYHHNLLAHCAGRNWSLAGGLNPDGVSYAGWCDIRNNVVYNWKDRTTDGGVYRCTFVKNNYIPGPATTLFLLMRPDGDQMGLGDPQMFFINNNKLWDYPQYDSNNWAAVQPNYATEAEIRASAPLMEHYVTPETVDSSYHTVLANAGAIYPRRDAIDTRIVREVSERSFTYRGSIDNMPGIIDSQDDVGGYPVLKGGPVPADSDHDGLPDWWETANGTDINSPAGDFSDSNGDTDGDGFTELDVYLEYLATGGLPFGSFRCVEGIRGDVDGDCEVGVSDLNMLAGPWLSESAPLNIAGGDVIDLSDLAALAVLWLDCNREPAAECGM